jgi:NAD(P)-dependent dehydrogenase (short-subunit alcohol dehydrogenase family)
MDLLKCDTFTAALKWCEQHLETIREGYAFSKEAVIVWTKVSSYQLIKRGIRINCTLPGLTQTPMMAEFESATPREVLDAALEPINRRSTPEEQAGPLVFLNSSWASYINGVGLPTDGGFMAGVETGQIDLSVMTKGAT